MNRVKARRVLVVLGIVGFFVAVCALYWWVRPFEGGMP